MRTTPASRPQAAPMLSLDRVRGDAEPPRPRFSSGPALHRSLSPVLELLEALGHPALVLDRSGRIVAETSGFGALVAEHPAAAASRPLAARLLVIEVLAGRRRVSPNVKCASRTLIAPLCGQHLELRLLTPTLAPGCECAAIVLVAIRASSTSREAFLADRYRLTTREIAVALLLSEGVSVTNIAAQLGISVHTVRRHGERVYRKLGVKSRAALTSVVMRVATMVAGNTVGTG